MNQSSTPFELRLSRADRGRRADKILMSQLGKVSYSHIRKLFRQKRVTFNESPVDANTRLESRGILRVLEKSEEKPRSLLPNKKIRLSVIHRDEHILVIKKPAGLVTLPGPGHGSDTLAAALLGLCPELGERFDESSDYGLVHRLDRDTSGVMIVPLNPEVRATLMESFQSRSVEKRYLALVRGQVQLDSGEIKEPLLAPKAGEPKGQVSEEGAEAETHWNVLERLPSFTYIEFRPKTGRTHQLRIHSAHMGHPIAGDRLYSEPPFACKGLLLHSQSLTLTHPVTKETVSFESPLPRPFRRKLKRFAEREFDFTKDDQGDE